MCEAMPSSTFFVMTGLYEDTALASKIKTPQCRSF